jgi:hypothetical protein
MHGMNFIHVDMGLPWWGVVAAASIGIRALVLPIHNRTVRCCCGCTPSLLLSRLAVTPRAQP